MDTSFTQKGFVAAMNQDYRQKVLSSKLASVLASFLSAGVSASAVEQFIWRYVRQLCYGTKLNGV